MWSALFVTVLFGCQISVRAGVLYAAAPQDQGQYYRKDPGTSYNYGYNTGDGSAKVEVKRKDGSVVGSYRYFDPNGKQIVRSYIADSKGFRILGNDLPVAPETPAAAVIGAPALTASVEGANQAVVEAAQHPSKAYSTVDIRNIAAPTIGIHGRSGNPGSFYTYGDGSRSNNYFAYPYQYNYDFPAGFAYPTLLTVQQLPAVVGAAEREAAPTNTIPVGVRAAFPRETFGIEGRKFRPVLVRKRLVVGKRY